MSLEKQILLKTSFKVFLMTRLLKILSKEDYTKYINAKQTLFFNKGESLFEEGRNVEGVFL